MFEYNTGFLFFSYFSIKCYFPGSLACLVILQILILNPSLLVPGYFCILVSVLELSSEATVKPAVNSLIPLGLALELCQVGLDQRSAHGGRTALNAPPSALSAVDSAVWLVGTGTILAPSGYRALLLGGSFLRHMSLSMYSPSI